MANDKVIEGLFAVGEVAWRIVTWREPFRWQLIARPVVFGRCGRKAIESS